MDIKKRVLETDGALSPELLKRRMGYSEETQVLADTAVHPDDEESIQNPGEKGDSSVYIAGKVGELAQGVDNHGAWLVAGTVSASPFGGGGFASSGGPLRLTGSGGNGLQKTRLAVNRFLEVSGIKPEEAGRVHLVRNTPVGKGLGSSSVDAALGIMAVAHANGVPAHPATIYQILCSVERSDPCWMASDLVFARPEAGVYEVWGAQPDFLLVAWDTAPGGTVDTQQAAAFDGLRCKYLSEYAEILQLIRTRRTPDLLRAATWSATINNRYLPKPFFDETVRLAASLDVGVLCAHSGTYLGLLLPRDASPALLGRVRREISGLGFIPHFFFMGYGNDE